jgi:hypothetical protein
MKKICRNLSVCLGVVAILILAISVILIINKEKSSKIVYAQTIRFCTSIGSFEMLIDNELILDETLVEITPSDCSFKPVFSIKKSTEDDEISIVGNKYKFETAGKYTLYCKVASGSDYYVKDSININVVSSPTQNTSMYISNLPLQTFYVEDIIDLLNIVDIKSPDLSKIMIYGSEHILIENGIIKAVKDGVATLDILLDYNHIMIMGTVSFVIKPSIQDSGVGLKLSVDGNVLTKNTLEVQHTTFYNSINYELTNLEHNQNITCWTDSDLLTVISYDAPTIIFATTGVGDAIIYVSPKAHPEIVFEIVITII